MPKATRMPRGQYSCVYRNSYGYPTAKAKKPKRKPFTHWTIRLLKFLRIAK